MFWPANVNGFIVPGLFDALPRCANERRTITGYPEYEEDYTKLGTEQQRILDEIAKQIVYSHSTTTPIVAVLVQGYADTALKKPMGERADFEQKVSDNRALSGEKVLRGKIRDTPPNGKDIESSVKFQTKGVGSTDKLVQNAFTEEQMRMNRRVEFLWARCFVPEPPVGDTLTKRVSRLQELLKTRKLPDLPGHQATPEHRQQRVHCLLQKMQTSGVLDVFVDGYATNAQIGSHFVGQTLADWNGNYDPPPLSDADFQKFLSTVTLHLKGSGFDPKNADDKVMEMLSHLMLRMDLGISQVDDYIRRNPSTGFPNSIYTGDQTRKKLQNLYRDVKDPKNVYSCYQ